MIKRYSFMIAISLLAVLFLLGLTTTHPSTLQEAEQETGFLFEWVPEVPDYAYQLEVATSEGITCDLEGENEGSFAHKSGLGSYRRLDVGGGSFAGSAATRADDSLHVGPLNTAHATGPLWGQLPRYESFWLANITNGESATSVVVGLDADLDGTNFLRVECNEEPELRLFLADAIEPIVSHTSTGGAGFHVDARPDLTFFASANKDDFYSMETAGERVFFAARSAPLNDPDLDEPQLKGEVTLISPHGDETIPLEPDEFGWSSIHRTWTGAGEYGLEMDRYAMNQDSMIGALLGFVLEEEFSGNHLENINGSPVPSACGGQEITSSGGEAHTATYGDQRVSQC